MNGIDFGYMGQMRKAKSHGEDSGKLKPPTWLRILLFFFFWA
jgi:hypothetical protein